MAAIDERGIGCVCSDGDLRHRRHKRRQLCVRGSSINRAVAGAELFLVHIRVLHIKIASSASHSQFCSRARSCCRHSRSFSSCSHRSITILPRTSAARPSSPVGEHTGGKKQLPLMLDEEQQHHQQQDQQKQQFGELSGCLEQGNCHGRCERRRGKQREGDTRR